MMGGRQELRIAADEGYFFGLAFFETIAVEQGRPLFLKEHLERLNASLKIFGLDRRLTTEEALAACRELVFGRGALKVMVSEKNVLFLSRENPYTPRQYQEGFTMDFSQVRRNETSPLTRHKTANYGDCILEKRAASGAGMDERIFLNTKGQIAEGTVSNIFFVRQGQIFTPPKECGLLPGIVRRYVLEREGALERVILPEELWDFEECFVTNSLMGVMPVKRLQDRTFPGRSVTIRTRERYLARTEE